VPERDRIELPIQAWIAQLELIDIQTVELYGYRNGSELPFWRSAFDPNDPRLKILKPAPVIELVEPQTAAVTPAPQIEDTQPAAAIIEEWSSPGLLVDLPMAELEVSPPGDIATQNNIEISSLDHQALERKSTLEAEKEAIALPNADNIVSEQKIKVVQDFLARYAAGERAFAKINLSETDLSGVNLTLADLHEADFIWANLSGAGLYHVNLSGAKLRHTNLSGAKLRSANLQGTDFLNANLSGADLSWSNLHGANLTGANLTDANLQNAIIERVIMPDGTYLD
jgi:hypothetical protein